MTTFGMIAEPIIGLTHQIRSLDGAVASAGPRRRPADGRYPEQAPFRLDPSYPLGCQYHGVCPGRGPIGSCDSRAFEPDQRSGPLSSRDFNSPFGTRR